MKKKELKQLHGLISLTFSTVPTFYFEIFVDTNYHMEPKTLILLPDLSGQHMPGICCDSTPPVTQYHNPL